MKRGNSGETKDTQELARRKHSETPLRRTLRAILLAFTLWAAWSATFILYPSPGHVNVVVGEPSPRDIKAPRQVTYISQVKTQAARAAAAAKVQDVYTGPDLGIARQKIETLRKVTDYITAIRYDQYASSQKKIELITSIPAPKVSAEIAEKIVALDDEAWQSVITESLRVLDLTMREEIRPNQVAEAKRRALRLTTPTLPDDQRAIVLAFVQGLISPNSFFDAEETLARREEARKAVQPVHWTIREGESILREGEIVTDMAMEKLRVLGLLERGIKWQDAVGISLLLLIVVVSLSLYVVRGAPDLLFRPRRETLLVLTLIALGVAARAFIPEHTLMPYLFPTAAAAMLIAVLMDVQLALIVAVISALLVALNADRSLEVGIYSLLGSLVGALTIWRMDQLGAFIRAAVYVGLTNAATILAFRLPNQRYDLVGLVQLMGGGMINGIIASSLTFVTFSLIGRIFDITTSLQLLELARPTHPLFKRLLTEAPGTYHHSIIVSNMAERAAEAIGADALLARVGSYYHDIGKIVRPYFFAENQSDGVNPHDKLDPKTSAEIIISHTTEGLELARKYKLPGRVGAFIPEHHGTTLVTYFYRQASRQSDSEDVREEDFRYPGPKPQSRETAIVMLADGIEAWVRANRPGSQEEIERVIRQVINDRLISGQLDECDLTLKDLDRIREAFASVLKGIFHPRIQYPAKTLRRNNQQKAAKSNGFS